MGHKNFDWNKIKGSAGNVAVFHGDNNPYVPLDESKDFAENLGSKLQSSQTVASQ